METQLIQELENLGVKLSSITQGCKSTLLNTFIDTTDGTLYTTYQTGYVRSEKPGIVNTGLKKQVINLRKDGMTIFINTEEGRLQRILAVVNAKRKHSKTN